METTTCEREAKTSTRKTIARRRLSEPTRRSGVRQPAFPPNERAMLFWIETAARFHTDPAHYALVALKTVAAPQTDETAQTALYVWEVAWCLERSGIKWKFIVWDVSGYGIRFRACASQDEAMALYHLPAEQGLAVVRDSPAVYLRPDRRPR